MDVLLDHISTLNWWAVLAAVAATYVIGYVWYSKSVFGSQWMRLVGLKDENIKNSDMLTPMIGTGIFSYFSIVALATLMSALAIDGTIRGAALGILVALGFVVTSKGVHMIFDRTKRDLFLINAGYDVVFLGLSGAILGTIG